MPIPPDPEPSTVTLLLRELTAGRTDAMDDLMPIVYEELRRLAQHHLHKEPAGHTLSPTALVHEAYLKLVHVKEVQWEGRSHFLAVASQAMRRILVDHARTRNRKKRGAGAVAVSLGHADRVPAVDGEELVALDEALRLLTEVNPRQARVVECRFFGGLSLDETGVALGISLATAKRDWAVARAWLNQALSDEHPAIANRPAP